MTLVGAGNMAEALVRGIIRARLLSAQRLRVTDVERRRREHFQSALKVAAFERNGDGVRGAGVVVLAVKPQVLAEVLPEVGAALDAGALLISIAAGISTAWLEKRLPAITRVVRVMPNLPALAAAGASAYCLGARATAQDAELVEKLFQSVGVVLRLEETHLNAVTALSGSGPAYVFFLAEIMLQAAREMGLDPEASRTLTMATIHGAATLLEESDLEPLELRSRVTSKGGVTAAALAVLEAAHVRETFVQAILAAHKRAQELAE
ncbi:MAG: pyrroline-5-carboxylate reductase [Lentisphaerae bacterium]|nr:pyrroline-5-carboxylate reductase [Lentisphaerota bacterium]